MDIKASCVAGYFCGIYFSKVIFEFRIAVGCENVFYFFDLCAVSGCGLLGDLLRASHAGAVGFAKATEIMKPAMDTNYAHLLDVSSYAIEKITEAGAKVNLPEARAPHILSITLPRIKSQTMLNLLSAGGVCVSSGSACSSNAKNRHVSSALVAFGLTEADADCTVRMSLCKDNTREDIDTFADLLASGIKRLVKIKR